MENIIGYKLTQFDDKITQIVEVDGEKCFATISKFHGRTGKINELWKDYTGWLEKGNQAEELVTPEDQILIDEGKMSEIRSKRNQLLKNSDFSQLPDVGLSATKITKWKTYRQKLRDLPESVDIENPIFPDKPE